MKRNIKMDWHYY